MSAGCGQCDVSGADSEQRLFNTSGEIIACPILSDSVKEPLHILISTTEVEGYVQYEKSSDHESFARYNRDQQEMFDRLQSAYTAMAGKYQLQLIPCGEMIQKLRKTPYFQEEGDRSICRDGFHMHYLYGRYALGCMWAAAIAGVSIKDNAFQPYTEYLPYGEPGAEILKCIRKIVAEMPHS